MSREAVERAGLGLLSRFIGAVFLVLLGGLLLLDRALLHGNQNLAHADAAAAGLLAESFVAAHVATLDRIADVIAGSARRADSNSVRSEITSAIASTPAVRELWASDSSSPFAFAATSNTPHRTVPPALLDSLRRATPAAGLRIGATSAGARSGWIVLTREIKPGIDGPPHTIGLLVDADSLRSLLDRTSSTTRRSLVVIAGRDTIVHLEGSPSDAPSARDTAGPLVRLPNGGTWQIVAGHSLTSRPLRWGIWIVGVLGVLFLAIGLLREQRRAQQVAERSMELERLYSDVKRANQAKSEFLANVSHELRTPLNAIVGFVELLRDGFYGDLSPRQVPPVDRIAASATHLRHLVDQVLDIAKIAAGRLEVHPETIVLRPFVLNVASELESLVSEKGLAFSITVGASLPRVRTDPTHLRQILINLIGNAVKYTATGTISVRARLLGAPPGATPRVTPTTTRPATSAEEAGSRALLTRAPRSGTWVALQVVDSGVGIAASDLERIFDEFEQVNAGPRGDSMQRGTGLGLAISRRLARLLGGEISVESELGRGSTFTVWLPVNPADLAREQPSTPHVAAATDVATTA